MSKKAQVEKQHMKSDMNKLSLEIDNLKRTKVHELEEMKIMNERSLIDQAEGFKSRLVVEYDKFDKLQEEYNKIKEASVKKVEELEKSIESRVEKIKQEFNVR